MANRMSPQEEDIGMERNRFPTLGEVLSRRTRPPVDLFSFYIYMRDQQRSVDYLDFWLDVSQHMSLCRHYVRELRRSVLLETPEMEKAVATGSKRSSQILDNFDLRDPGPAGSLHSQQERSQDQRISAMLRSDPLGHSAKDSQSTRSGHNGNGNGNGNGSGNGYRNGSRNGKNSESQERTPRRSYMGSEFDQDSSSPDKDSTPQHTVARADIRASAEKILYTFLLPGSEREIILPQGILIEITEAIEEQGRDDPEVFDAAKDYVFQAMERDAFPGFLRAKALGNLVPPSLMMRLIIGLLATFGGWWAAFALIFLNLDRATRCWLILPFSVGVYALASHQYALDPIIALVGYSEYTFFNFSRIREPFVRKMINKRSLIALLWIILIDAALVCLFVFVPGKKL